MLYKKLNPSERAIYLMKSVFNYDYSELMETFEKKKDHCRQLYKRAKDKLDTNGTYPDINLVDIKDKFDEFINAYHSGTLAELTDSLKQEISEKIK